MDRAIILRAAGIMFADRYAHFRHLPARARNAAMARGALAKAAAAPVPGMAE